MPEENPAASAPPPSEQPVAPPPPEMPNYEWLPPVISSPANPPPLAAADAAMPPPLPPGAAATPRPVGPALTMATWGVGAVAFVLTVLGLQNDPKAGNIAYSIGKIVGAFALWPAVFVGLFSIFRRFRNARSRSIILLAVWSLSLFAQLGEFARRRAADAPPEPSATASASTTEPLAKIENGPPAPAPAAAPAEPPAARAFDFTAGSDERLIKKIESAQESTYRAIAAAYAAECRARPADVTLAVERARFSERFAYAEDVTFPTAEADLEAAKQYLHAQFGQTAAAQLYELERVHGDEFETMADAAQPAIRRWTQTEQARFWLLRAQRRSDAVEVARAYAASAYELAPGPEAAVILARGLIARRDLAGARRVLAHDSFARAADWMRVQQMQLLFDAGAREEAIGLFEQLRAKDTAMLRTVDIAQKLAAAGRLDLAREIFSSLASNQWNRARVARQRFDFELEHGNAVQATAAYRALREAGFETDAFGRERAKLFLKHPGAAWALVDVISFAALGVLLVFAALLPLVVVLPVHYWGLLRRAKGKLSAWNATPWGLRSGLLVLVTICVSLFVGFWIFNPGIFQNAAGEAAPTAPPALSPSAVLGPPTILWCATLFLVLILLWRARGWRLVGSGDWDAGKAFGVGLGLALAIRVAIGIYVTVFGLKNLAIAEAVPASTQFFATALAALGPWGFFALVALFVPVLEELLFRGVLLGALARHVPFWAANTAQSLVFLAMHEEMRLAPFFFAIAFVNGELVRRSRGLFAGIVLHVVNNAIVALVLIVRGT